MKTVPQTLRLLLGFLLAVMLMGAMSPDVTTDPMLISNERVVFRTTMGDLVFAFYPNAAPEHAAQFFKLAQLGVFTAMPVYQVRPGFLIQFGDAKRKRIPLTEEQLAAIHPLKAEFNTIKHRRGCLSMARRAEDPNSAETSFCVLLANAPHLDGKYTVFGLLVEGYNVLDAISAVSTNENQEPLDPIEVTRVGWADRPSTLETLEIRRGVIPQPLKPRTLQQVGWFLWGMGATMVCGLLLLAFANQLTPHISSVR